MSFLWSDEKVEQMRDHARIGHSATQVAALFGTSRCSVLGKAFRNGISFNGGKTPKAIRKPRTRLVWCDRVISRMRELAEKKLTSTDIASILSREFTTVSASAVRARAAEHKIMIGGGRVHQFMKRREKALILRRERPNIPAPSFREPVDISGIVPVRLRFDQLVMRSCRYPIGDPQDSDFAFCGLDNLGKSSYCPSHRQLCYGGKK